MLENFRRDFDLIIFDCDGTLVDTEYLNSIALCQIIAEEGLPQYDIDYAMVHFVGQRMGACLEKITFETGYVFPDSMSARYAARAQDLAPQYFKIIPGAAELVEAAQRTLPICVASNGQRENVLDSLQRAGLLQYFPADHVFTGVQVRHAKPAPDLFFFAAEQMKIDPARALVIEDSLPGVMAGAAAKMFTIGFTGAHRDKAYYSNALLQAGANMVSDSLPAIQNMIFQK